MALSQNPLTGQMTGSIGNFVTSTLNGKNVIRSKAFSRRDANSEAQQKQRGGFKMIGELFTMLGSITQEGFAQRATESSVYAAFMAANLSGAIDKSGGEAVIDYSKLKVADGTLSMPVVKSASITSAGISISYQSALKNQLNLPTDEMVALALLTNGELWIERQPRGEAGQSSILIPVEEMVSNDVLGVYLFCKRADGSKVSKSVYLQLT